MHYAHMACVTHQWSGEGIKWGFLDITFYALQEARVRFAGFGKEEDEWVSVRKGIRERSIPLEPSECHRINTGDLVLCFQVPFIFELTMLSITPKKIFHMLITESLQVQENVMMTKFRAYGIDSLLCE